MKPQRVRYMVLCLFLNAALLSGCASSSIESRRAERISAYAALKPEFQQLVDQGRISIGMPAAAVYIAWGKPSEVTQGQLPGASTEIWRYYGTSARPRQYWEYGPLHRPGHGFHRRHESDHLNYNYALPYLETEYHPQRYLRGEVLFQNGIVKDLLVPNPTHGESH